MIRFFLFSHVDCRAIYFLISFLAGMHVSISAPESGYGAAYTVEDPSVSLTGCPYSRHNIWTLRSVSMLLVLHNTTFFLWSRDVALLLPISLQLQRIVTAHCGNKIRSSMHPQSIL